MKERREREKDVDVVREKHNKYERDRDKESKEHGDKECKECRDKERKDRCVNDNGRTREKDKDRERRGKEVLEKEWGSEKEKAIKLSRIFEEQDKMNDGDSEDDDAAEKHNTKDLGGVRILHGLDEVLAGGAIVLTLKDQSILADGDVNEEVDMLENGEIGEQRRRDEAYKAGKKKTCIYDDMFNDEPGVEKRMLPQYDDLTADERVTLDSCGRFTGEAEKKLKSFGKNPWCFSI